MTYCNGKLHYITTCIYTLTIFSVIRQLPQNKHYKPTLDCIQQLRTCGLSLYGYNS